MSGDLNPQIEDFQLVSAHVGNQIAEAVKVDDAPLECAVVANLRAEWRQGGDFLDLRSELRRWHAQRDPCGNRGKDVAGVEGRAHLRP
jgi:hypothetical protein